jgi:hypothetical protein
MTTMPMMLHRMPSPETYPTTAETRCPALLADWLRLNPDAVPTERDHEDWAEPAAIMVAMSRRGDVVRVPAAPQQRTCGDRTPAPRARPGSPKAIMWGIFNDADAREFPIDADLAWNAWDKTSLVQNYASSPVFLERAGRPFHVCDMDRDQIAAALQSLVDGGADAGFIKTRDKGTAYAFSLADDGRTNMLGKPVSLFSRMDGEDQNFSWKLMSREGDKACVFVQGAFKPTREYRVIVVGDKVACGAGCIEAFTPGESEGAFFDDRMEVVRNDGETVRDPELAARYLDFAREYAAAWAAEHGAECGYSLDLSVDAESGTIVPIEMNPLLNLGLYANDADRIVDAMLGIPHP